MKFAFTDEQIEFRDAVRDLLAKECTPQRLRDAWTNETGRIPGLWQQLADMGVVGLLAPEAAGGLGLDDVDLVLILEETGRVALPEPIVETAAIAVPLLRDARPHSGPNDGELLAAIVRGEQTAAVGGDISGLEAWADTASMMISTGNGAVSTTGEWKLTRRESVDGSRRLFESTAVWRAYGWPANPIPDRGAYATAAQLLGLADRMIELTVDYAKERKQFGVPIGSFQAVKHHLANARLALEFARPLVYRAAYSIAHDDPERSVHVSMAKAQASDAASVAARVALQCHGAIGYTTEYDLHLYMKRAWALARAWGDAAWHRRRIEHTILGGTDG
jgi:alkylation response protein AidB-like acyl-CoA dehydrogenase